MRIGLHDAENEYMKHKTFPNYALMKISAYHKARGGSRTLSAALSLFPLVLALHTADMLATQEEQQRERK